MREIVGESLARRLVEWGVDTIFGLPGDGINGLMEGFRRQREKLRFVLVHHEEAAAFMATGYAKATGKLGVCCATSGPGAIHLLNGLYDAKLDHVPVLAITGMQETSVLGSRYQQEVHTELLFQDVAAYNLMVAMLVGVGARGARDEVLAVAEALGSPIVKTLSGKMVVPDDHPLTTGGLGLLGTKPSEELMEECDTLLMVGTSFPYGKYLPSPGQARVVQIDVEPSLIGMRLPVAAPVTADARLALRQLLPLLIRHPDRSFLTKYQRGMASWRSDMAALQDESRDPIAPQYLMASLDDLAADDAILTCDSGTIATWAARHWTIRGDREFYLSGNLASMAPGLPYAIAMQHAQPG